MVLRLAEQPDPEDPQINQLAINPQRQTLITLFAENKQQKVSQRGPVDATATVTRVAGTTAQATTCLNLSFVRVYEAGRRRPGSGGGLALFLVNLRRVEGTWRVYQVTNQPRQCGIPR